MAADNTNRMVEIANTALVANNLDALALRIRDASMDALGYAKKATECALITGALLIEAKAQVEHGEWDSWVVENCWVAVSTARAYMGFAKKFQKLDLAKQQRVIDLPLREALKAIATDPTPTPKPAYSSTYRPARTDREKTQAVFGKAVSVLKLSSKAIDVGLKEKQVNDLRKKLNEVLDELDRLEASAKSEAIDVVAVEVTHD